MAEIERLETPEALAEYLRRQPQETESERRLAFARRFKIVRPPALGLLPERMTLRVNVLRDVAIGGKYVERKPEDYVEFQEAAELIESIRRDLLREAAAISGEYEEMAQGLAQEGWEILGSGRKKGRAAPAANETLLPGTFHDLLDLPQVLGAVHMRHLSKRDPSAAAFLRRANLRFALFKDGRIDVTFLSQLRCLPSASVSLHRLIYSRFGVTVKNRREQVFRAFSTRELNKMKEAIMILAPGVVTQPGAGRALADLKRGIFTWLNTLFDEGNKSITSTRKALGNIKELLVRYSSRVSAENITRIRSRIQNFAEKLEAFHGFYDREFGLSRVESIHRALEYLQQTGSEAIEVSAGRYVRESDFLLVPSKCYLELWKGFASRDCTKEADLSEAHLATERFFNIRIYDTHEGGQLGSEVSWIGNIYCLDFTDLTESDRVILLDRIQLSRGASVFPISFFPALSRTLISGLPTGSGIRFLAPAGRISNFPGINESYAKWRKGRPSVEFSEHTPLTNFASAAGSRFFVLEK